MDTIKKNKGLSSFDPFWNPYKWLWLKTNIKEICIVDSKENY